MPGSLAAGSPGAAELVLRAWGDADAPALVAAWADPEVRRWTVVPEPADLDVARRWIAGWDERRRRRLALDLVAADPGDDRVLGEVGLSSFDDGRSAARIGWWTAPGARGRGVASAMVAALTAWAHDGPLGLRVVVAEVDEANPASVAVARRAGYRRLHRPGVLPGTGSTQVFVSQVGSPESGPERGPGARV